VFELGLKSDVHLEFSIVGYMLLLKDRIEYSMYHILTCTIVYHSILHV
jgi:hypothetical protein